jgi:hypothetical protein
METERLEDVGVIGNRVDAWGRLFESRERGRRGSRSLRRCVVARSLSGSRRSHLQASDRSAAIGGTRGLGRAAWYLQGGVIRNGGRVRRAVWRRAHEHVCRDLSRGGDG